MKDLKDLYWTASQIFVEQQKVLPEVIGIIISGSLLTGALDKNSDIDIHIILSANCGYRERGNTWINGVEIEYFKNPPAQILSYFEKEKQSPHTAHMLAHGKIVYQDSALITQLKEKATTIWQQKPSPLPAPLRELRKYMLDDFYKDLEDAQLAQDPVGLGLIRAKIINYGIDIFCREHQIYRAKDKRLLAQLQSIDAHFAQAVQHAFVAPAADLTSLKALRVLVENLLGGRRSREWRFRSALDV